MPKEIAMFEKGNVPAHIRDRKTALGKVQLKNSIRFNRLSFDKNRFSILQSGHDPKRISGDYFDCVIIHAAESEQRLYYEGDYDPKNPSRPVCFSADGKKPHAKSEVKQHPKSCQLCEQNVKGSGNQDTKACKYTYPIVILPLNDDQLILQPLVANINGGSLYGPSDDGNQQYNLIQYNTHLEDNKVPTSLIVTRLYFDEDAEASPNKVLFAFERFLEEEEIDSIEAAVEDKEAYPLDAMVSVTLSAEELTDEEAEEEYSEEEESCDAEEAEESEEQEEEAEEAPPAKPARAKAKKASAKKKAKPVKKAEPVDVSEDELEEAGIDGLNFDV